jgi:hypothetical protein
MNKLKSVEKSILVGGAAAGVVSLLPVINLLNLVFMMWMAVGGGICVYLLLGYNKQIKISEAAVTGALSGVLGCLIFGTVTYIGISFISPAKLDRIGRIVRLFSSSGEEEISRLFEGNEWKIIFLAIIGTAFVLSIISGALGGIVARAVFSEKKEKETTLQTQEKG